MPKTNKFENPERRRLIEKLKLEGRGKKVNLWVRIAEELSKGRKNRRETNIWKINKYCKDGEFVLIPGKVLGYGNLEHKVNVVAFKFSKSAKEKIKSAGGEVISIEELLRRNPTGSKVKILC